MLRRIAAGEHIPEGHWLIADRQMSGRGRQGRNWADAVGNFMGSTVVHLPPGQPMPATLSFVVALAVCETVVPLLADPRALVLKWPNDLLLYGQKLCGILIEREGACAVVGIGVNLAHAPQIDGRSVTSLAATGPSPDVQTFAHSLAVKFDLELERWRQQGTESLFRRWLAAAHPIGAPLSVHDGQGVPAQGTFDGLAPDGALRLRLANGASRVIHAGDVNIGDF